MLVADITYIKSRQGAHYLSLMTDAYSRRIVGYHLSHRISADDVLKVWNMAIKNKRFSYGIHYSDRDLQYAFDVYQQELKQANIKS